MKSAISQATRGLLSNKVRTALTSLGVIIGIATIIIVVSAGEGFRSFINYQIDQFGSNTIYVETRVPATTRDRNNGASGANQARQAVQITTLKRRDVEDIRRIPGVVGAYGAVIGQKTVNYKQTSKNTFIFGADPDRFIIDKGKLAVGRPYTEQENLGADQVAILGADISENLFGESDPLGKIIRVGEYNFTVIGVYERRGSFGFSNDDEQVFIPLITAQKKLLGIDHLLFIVAQGNSPDSTSMLAEEMRIVLRRNHGIDDPAKDDFSAQNQAQSLETFNQILAGVTYLLIAVAAISLLVGGVGIMNIMYVVVTERTSEIGLKKALGATNKDIIKEFVIESVLLTVSGGLLGILLGTGISFLISKVAAAQNFPWVFSVPISGVVMGLSLAAILGLTFGVFPARSAGKMDPIEALRQE